MNDKITVLCLHHRMLESLLQCCNLAVWFIPGILIVIVYMGQTIKINEGFMFCKYSILLLL